MDLVRLCIPYAFIRKRTNVSWRDIHFGLVNQLLAPDAPIALAVDQVDELADPPAALLDLAGAGKNQPTLELVERLAEGEPGHSDDEIRSKWLYLVLAWLYEHRHEDSDPLQRIEEVYADFGYPEQLAGFVRYMPMAGPDLGSREANERRLFERWKQYVDDAGRTSSS